MIAAEQFVNNVKALMEHEGLSASDLARRLGVSHQAVTAKLRLEKAMTLDVAREWAEALGVHWWELGNPDFQRLFLRTKKKHGVRT